MKTAEELNAIREKVEAINKNLADLNEEELEQVTGGSWIDPFYKFTAGQRIILNELTPEYVNLYVIVKVGVFTTNREERVPVTLYRQYHSLESADIVEIDTDYSVIELSNAQSRQW